MRVLPLLRPTPGVVLLLTTGLPGASQEVSAFMGVLHSNDPDPAIRATYTWQFGYAHQIIPGAGLYLGWLNEGHLTDHHRDGPVIQAWTYLLGRGRPLSLLGGLGAYRWYDTVSAEGGVSHVNQHGICVLGSLMAQYRPAGAHWQTRLQLNATSPIGGRHNLSLLGGVGYIFAEDAPKRAPLRAEIPRAMPRHEISFLFGKTVLNSLSSETSEAYLVQYRHAFSPHWGLVASYANEGVPGGMRRDGMALQASLAGAYMSGRFLLGFALGPHWARVKEEDSADASSSYRVGGRATLGAGWRVSEDLVVRLAWNRNSTHYDRDTDLLMAGLGYTW